MNLESSKTLGGVGALLIVIAGIGSFGTAYVGVLGLVGIILVLIALKGMADNYNEAGIFNNALYAIVIAIIGGVAFVGAVVASVFMLLSNFPAWARELIDKQDWAGLATQFQERFRTGFTDMNFIWSFLGAIVLALVVLFVFAIIAMIFFRKSLKLLSAKSGVGLFGTAGLLMLIGAILTIIVIGLLLMWIAWILVTIAFFTVKTQVVSTPPPPQPLT